MSLTSPPAISPSAPLTLAPFQREGATFLAANPGKVALIGDRMGLGKTPQAIMAVQQLALSPQWTAQVAPRVLILAPLATAAGWAREVDRWTGGRAKLRIVRRRNPIPDPVGLDRSVWTFIAWTDLATHLSDLILAGRFGVVIADEVHKTKSLTSKIGNALWGVWRRDKVTNAWERTPGLIDQADRLWCLSGTPMPNGRPIELFRLLQAAGVPMAKRRQEYVDRYCYRENKYNDEGFDNLGANNLPEFNANLAKSGVYLARTPKDVPGQLPDLRRGVCPLTESKHLEVDGYSEFTLLTDDDGRPILPPFKELAAYRAELGLRKVKHVANWIADFVNGDKEDSSAQPIVLFVHHVAVGKAVRELLIAAGISASEVIDGTTSPEERQAAVDAFAQPNGPLVFIGTTGACGTGMNGLHKRTTVCAFAEGEWAPDVLDQAEGRIRRMGGAGGADAMALAFYLVVEDSLEAHIMSMIADKRANIQIALEAPAPPAPAPAPAPASPESEDPRDPAPDCSDPADLAWGWSKDRDTDEWLVRANGAPATEDDWIGLEVTAESAAGKRTTVILESMVRSGRDWSVWAFTRVEQPRRRYGWGRRY